MPSARGASGCERGKESKDLEGAHMVVHSVAGLHKGGRWSYDRDTRLGDMGAFG